MNRLPTSTTSRRHHRCVAADGGDTPRQAPVPGGGGGGREIAGLRRLRSPSRLRGYALSPFFPDSDFGGGEIKEASETKINLEDRSMLTTYRKLKSRTSSSFTSKGVVKSTESPSPQLRNSSVLLDTEKVVDFSQRQMHDIANIAANLIRSLKHMRSSVNETLSSEAHSLLPSFNTAEEGLVGDAAAVKGPVVHVLEQDVQLLAALAHAVAAHHLWVLPRDLAPHRVVVVLSYRGLGTVDGCSYLVLLSYRGLGNQILAMSSAFHYAMLTDRVLLVGRGKTMGDLFCEPFRGRSDHGEGRLSVLPRQRPMARARSIKIGTCFFSSDGCRHCRNTSLENKLAYCDDHRQFLHRVQCVVMRTDGYIAPSLFLNPAYQQELDRMFPRKDSVFYIISRYLLHPTNDVWGMVTRFYNSYLKNADERMGIQIRVSVQDDKPVQHILD
ncbi:hypothetical protein ZWY2020_015425 [Hordeum vulgare]|nr:hypothetical protein ZWY2020_015425 [Hordeum vulgare]